MRNPDNVNTIESSTQSEQIIKLDNIPVYNIQDYDLDDPKDFRRFSNDVEKAVRTSFEYTEMVSFLRNYMNMNSCSIYSQVNNIETTSIKIHIHHEPITLYDIFIAVYNKRKDNHEPITVDMVAKEIMYNHYMLRVGLIPLAETVHELVHNQFIFIPSHAVFGKYWEFVELYKDYMEDGTISTLKNIEELSNDIAIKQASNILGKNLIYINADNVFEQTNIDEVKDLLKDRLNSYKKESVNNDH